MPRYSPVNIAVCGKFHMLNYLPDLVGRGVVQRFYMSHKPSTARSLELPSEVVRNFPAKEYFCAIGNLQNNCICSLKALLFVSESGHELKVAASYVRLSIRILSTGSD